MPALPALGRAPAALALAPALLTACQGTFSADLHNQTPQPLFAQIHQRTDDGWNPILAEKRLGPGDRGAIGPVHAPIGRAYITLATIPNPQGIWSTDLRPGTTSFNVSQQGDQTIGPIEVREVSFSPP